MPGNLFSKRPDWLFRALGLNDPSVPNTLHMDGVSPVVDVVQSGWSAGRFFNIRADMSNPAAAIIGNSSWPTLPGGLLVEADETVVVLGLNFHNSTAGAVGVSLFVTPTAPVPPGASRLLLGFWGGIAAGQSHSEAQYTASMHPPSSILPLIIPPGYMLGDGNGVAGVYAHVMGIRLPAGVKPL